MVTIECRECLLIIQSIPISYPKNLKIRIYKTNFASCTVWVQTFVSQFEEGTQNREQSVEDIWT